MRTYRFRLYPTREQEKEMSTRLWAAKNLWNALLEAEKEKYANEGKFLSFTGLCKLCRKSGMYAQSAQAVAHRLHRALQAKLKAKREGREWGFPRFKSFDRMKSLHYPQFGFSLGEKLRVSPFGEISIVKHRAIEGTVKTLTIKRMPSGKWFASFAVECEPAPRGVPAPPRENRGGVVGIDLGLKAFATLSDGGIIENPRHLARHEVRLALLSRKLSKKKRGSANKGRARLPVARLHERVASARRDFLHKESTRLVNAYSLIAIEDLQIPDMAGQRFGKQIHDAGRGTFAGMLGYKAEEAGCRVVLVNPKDTTRTCSCCGVARDMPLSERHYDCPQCGLSIGRDLNAARNILIRATQGYCGSNACGLLHFPRGKFQREVTSLTRSGDAAAAASGKQEAHTL